MMIVPVAELVSGDVRLGAAVPGATGWDGTKGGR